MFYIVSCQKKLLYSTVLVKQHQIHNADDSFVQQ